MDLPPPELKHLRLKPEYRLEWDEVPAHCSGPRPVLLRGPGVRVWPVFPVDRLGDVFEPITTTAQAVELESLLHPGIPVDSPAAYDAVTRTAVAFGFDAAGGRPASYGRTAEREPDGTLVVHDLVYEPAAQFAGVREYTLTIAPPAERGTQRSHVRQEACWLEGPLQWWQVGYVGTPSAEEVAAEERRERENAKRCRAYGDAMLRALTPTE